MNRKPRTPSPAPSSEPVEIAPERAPASETLASPAPERVATESTNLIGDLTADRPEAPARAQTLLNDIEPTPELSVAGRRCYTLIADMKKNIEKVSVDLDNNGKEVERLIRTADDLSRNITEMADLFPRDELLRNQCSRAKRNVLVLVEELSRTPVRQWAHVRWAFNSTLREVSQLRLMAKDSADNLPKPQRIVTKDGKVEFVEPSVVEVALDPTVARSEERKRALEIMKARMAKREDLKKNPPMEVDLDGLKAKD